jgi:hypothetical protein
LRSLLLVPRYFTNLTISAIIVILVIIGLILYHRRDKSKVSKTATQFVKFMGCLRCRCSAKKLKADDDENIILVTLWKKGGCVVTTYHLQLLISSK